MTETDSASAFAARIEEHRGIMGAVARVYCANPSDRDDLAQTMALELWRAYPRYDGRARFSTWMYRICVNVAISFYRRGARAHEREVPLATHDLALRDGATDDAQRDILDTFIAQLDELNRALVVLYLDGNSYAQIAAVLGISETNVATKLSRLKERFRRNAGDREHYVGTR